MPRKPLSEQDQQMEALFKQIKEIKARESSATDVRKALTTFRKAKTQLIGVMDSIEEAISILEGGGNNTTQGTERDPEAPYGRKKDGTPKKPGGKGSDTFKAKQEAQDGPGSSTGTSPVATARTSAGNKNTRTK